MAETKTDENASKALDQDPTNVISVVTCNERNVAKSR